MNNEKKAINSIGKNSECHRTVNGCRLYLKRKPLHLKMTAIDKLQNIPPKFKAAYPMAGLLITVMAKSDKYSVDE